MRHLGLIPSLVAARSTASRSASDMSDISVKLE